MQTVSENWKNVHKQTLLNESFVEVSLDIADPESLADASSEDNGAVYISDTSQVVSEVDKSAPLYCTLEQNVWLLDGGRKAIPESDFGNSGYISEVLSDDTCVFSSKMPIITIKFSKVFTKVVPGITITWSTTYGEFADNFIVRAYNGDTVVAEKEVIDNRSAKSLVMVDIVNYDRIEILIKKWCLPQHRARVEEIFVGMNKVYGKSELFDYSHIQSVSPVSTSLPKGEIKFSIDNSEGEYDPYNAKNGLSKYLMDRQEVKTRYGLKLNDGSIEWVKGGTFYLSEWSAKQNSISAEFTARDLLEFMSAIYHDNITEIKERSLYDLAISVLQSAELPLHSNGTVKWIVDDSLKTIYTTAPLPDDTLANCLQLIANAGRCVLYQDREGKLHIEPLKYDNTELENNYPEYIEDYRISSFNSYSNPEITLSKYIKQVNMMEYTYSKGDNGIESTSIETICKRVLNVPGEIITIDNPLVTSHEMAIAVACWIWGNQAIYRSTLDFSWRADVRIDALDLIYYQKPKVSSSSTGVARMTEINLRYNGAFRGTGKGEVIQ